MILRQCLQPRLVVLSWRFPAFPFVLCLRHFLWASFVGFVGKAFWIPLSAPIKKKKICGLVTFIDSLILYATNYYRPLRAEFEVITGI